MEIHWASDQGSSEGKAKSLGSEGHSVCPCADDGRCAKGMDNFGFRSRRDIKEVSCMTGSLVADIKEASEPMAAQFIL